MHRSNARRPTRTNREKYTTEQQEKIERAMPFWRDLRQKSMKRINVALMHHLLKLLNQIGILGKDASTPRYITH